MYLKNTLAFCAFLFAGIVLNAQVLTATVDVSCSANSTPAEVRMTGVFWGWDPVGGPVATDNGDGTWSVTFDPAPTADMEYKWLVDGVWEDLIPEMQNGGTCAPVTDYSSYANRLWTVGSGDIADTYDQCDACAPVNAPLVVSVEFCDFTPAEVRMTGAFWGWDPVGGPVATDNGDGTWSVTLDPAPTADMEYKWLADGVWEDLIQDMIDGGTCAPVTDYSSYANRLWTVGSGNMDDVFDQCVACTPAATPVTLTVEFCDLTPAEVRMTGPFWGWDPVGGPVATDNGDGTWSVTLDPAPTADMEYLWLADGVQENLIQAMVDGGTCAPVTDYFSYANRLWTVGSGDVSETYGQCNACPEPPVVLTVEICDATPSEVRMTGPFWGWDPVGGPVATDNGDGTWSVTLDPAPTADMEYLWLTDGVQENLIQAMVDGGTCAPVTDYFSYANRLWTVGSPDVTDDVYGQCNACGAAPLILTVELCDAASEVRMTGPFWGWDPVGGPVANDNGDGTWSVTLDPAPTTDMEYLWIADAVQENLIQAMVDGGTCAPVTDYFSYANRLWTVGSGDVNETYGQCEGCSVPGCTDPAADNYNPAATVDDGSCGFFVTFSVDMNEYMNAFGFVNVSGTWNEWCADCNQLSDDDMDGVWTGTIAIPDGDHQFKYQVDGWNDQEALTSDQSCTITMGGFTNRSLTVAGASQSFSTVCWASCFECASAGTPGCTDVNANNYDATATVNDGSCLYNVTFRVDMSQYAGTYTDVNLNGSFNSWCGACAIMTDPEMDGIYELVVELQDGAYEYKFTTDGWTDQEAFVEGDPCTVTNFGFTNRFIQVTSAATTEAYCWNSCSACVSGVVPGCTDVDAQNYNPAATDEDGSCLYNITFRVDMSQYAGAFTTVYVSGIFNSWAGNANPLADPDMDNVWEGTALVGAGDQEYKFQVDEWAADEQFVGGESCTITTGGFTNRYINVVGNTILPVVCWEACSACPSIFFDVTFRVDMFNQMVSANGVHIAGSFQGWDASTTQMTFLGYGIYEFTVSLAEGEVVEYKYINGNDFANAEVVPAECGADDGLGSFNRSLTVTADETVMVCFGECDACSGCTDPLSLEFNPFALTDDGSCATGLVYGCTYPSADNYNANANMEDGSCTFTLGSDCPEDLNNDGIVNAADLLQFLGAFGTTCQ